VSGPRAMVSRYDRDGIRIVEGDAREVSQTIEPGSCSLAILDGPYGMGKAAWDRVSDLPAWYAPHLDDVDRVCGASASLYVWNTAEGWAALHPGIVARGWTFRALVTWDKGVGFMAGKCDVAGLRTWYDVTEVCGFYQREAIPFDDVFGALAARMESERRRTGLRRADIDAAVGAANVSQYWWQAREWRCPTRAMWAALARVSGGFAWSWDDMKRDEATARAAYEASRPAFTCPLGVGNVWSHGQVTGSERLRAADGSTLHPCQKPLAFAERMIRASTRPGERVWVPFGGTCREAIAAQRIARADPAEAREVVTAELDEDGRDYLGAVVRVLEGRGTAPPTPGQVSLW